MYISIDMCHDRKGKKNVGTLGFVQFYIIRQHCLWQFQESRLFNKASFMLYPQCCPTSDESHPDKRRSPIRGAVREREYYSVSSFVSLCQLGK